MHQGWPNIPYYTIIPRTRAENRLRDSNTFHSSSSSISPDTSYSCPNRAEIRHCYSRSAFMTATPRSGYLSIDVNPSPQLDDKIRHLESSQSKTDLYPVRRGAYGLPEIRPRVSSEGRNSSYHDTTLVRANMLSADVYQGAKRM